MRGRRMLLCAYVVFLISSANGKVCSEDWPMFRADKLHSGFSVGTTDTLLGLVWKYPTNGPIHSSSVVSGNTLYFASVDNNLYAVDAATGALKWRCPLGNWIESTPAVTDGKVYVGCMDHKVYAIDTKSGDIKWTYGTSSWIESSPVIADNTLYIGGTDHMFYAIDAVSGKEKWRFRVGGDIFSSPAFYNGVIYFGADDDTLYAVNANGQLKWKYATQGYAIHSSPSIQDGILVVGTVDNGVKYRHEIGGYGSFNNKVLALDADTGVLRWEYAAELFGLMHSSPAVAYGMVYYPTDQGRLRALDISDGNLIWETEIPDHSPMWSSPAVAAGIVYVTSYGGALYLYSAWTGELLGSFSIPDEGVYIHSSPAIADSFLYFGASDGALYALGKQVTVTSVSCDNETSMPRDHLLFQNYPNPFNSATNITFSIKEVGRVTLRIYNTLGQTVSTLVDDVKAPGTYTVTWDGKDDFGALVASGIYFYRIVAGSCSQAKGMLMLR